MHTLNPERNFLNFELFDPCSPKYMFHRSTFDSGFPTAINGVNAVNALRFSHCAVTSKLCYLPPAPFEMTDGGCLTLPGIVSNSRECLSKRVLG